MAPIGLEQPLMVKPVDPVECGEFDVLQAGPGAMSLDDFRFEQANYCFSQRVVVRTAHMADRRLNIDISQTLAVADGQILHTSVAVMDEPFAGLAGMNRLIDRIQHQRRVRRVVSEGAGFSVTLSVGNAMIHALTHEGGTDR